MSIHILFSHSVDTNNSNWTIYFFNYFVLAFLVHSLWCNYLPPSSMDAFNFFGVYSLSFFSAIDCNTPTIFFILILHIKLSHIFNISKFNVEKNYTTRDRKNDLVCVCVCLLNILILWYFCISVVRFLFYCCFSSLDDEKVYVCAFEMPKFMGIKQNI